MHGNKTVRGKEIRIMSEGLGHHVMEEALVIRQEMLSEGIFSMWVKTSAALNAKPGQFVSLYTNNGATLLPRPISICQINRQDQSLRLVYRVVGKGTLEFSAMKAGDSLRLLGPLGNGYILKEKKAILAAGGIGIPPMLELARQLGEQCASQLTIVLGYRNEDLFLAEEFAPYGKVLISTEDGSVGTKGNVLDAIRENKIEAEVIYACGPMPMLKAVKQYAQSNKMEAQISLEEKMACGIGACLGCVVKTKERDSHSNVNNARICTDGPVFDAETVNI